MANCSTRPRCSIPRSRIPTTRRMDSCSGCIIRVGRRRESSLSFSFLVCLPAYSAFCHIKPVCKIKKSGVLLCPGRTPNMLLALCAMSHRRFGSLFVQTLSRLNEKLCTNAAKHYRYLTEAITDGTTGFRKSVFASSRRRTRSSRPISRKIWMRSGERQLGSLRQPRIRSALTAPISLLLQEGARTGVRRLRRRHEGRREEGILRGLTRLVDFLAFVQLFAFGGFRSLCHLMGPSWSKVTSRESNFSRCFFT